MLRHVRAVGTIEVPGSGEICSDWEDSRLLQSRHGKRHAVPVRNQSSLAFARTERPKLAGRGGLDGFSELDRWSGSNPGAAVGLVLDLSQLSIKNDDLAPRKP